MERPLVVYGYHGTSLEAARAIVNGRRFVSSDNESDWLGNGIYFWQDAPGRALEWPMVRMPKSRRIANPAVVGARIRLENCLDLLDIEAADFIAECYRQFTDMYMRHGKPLPSNQGGHHRLDCLVMNHTVGILTAAGEAVGAIRAAFEEGDPIFPGSALRRRAHVQITVLNPDLIEERFLLEVASSGGPGA